MGTAYLATGSFVHAEKSHSTGLLRYEHPLDWVFSSRVHCCIIALV